MHYKNGKEAREGDPVIGKNYNAVIAGKLHSLVPGITSCNAQVAYTIPGGTNHACITVSEFWLAADALEAAESVLALASPKVP